MRDTKNSADLNEKLPQVTPRQLIRAIEKDGWAFIRQSGSHRHYAHPEKTGLVTIAVHGSGDVKIGTLRSILKQAELSVDEFRRLP